MAHICGVTFKKRRNNQRSYRLILKKEIMNLNLKRSLFIIIFKLNKIEIN